MSLWKRLVRGDVRVQWSPTLLSGTDLLNGSVMDWPVTDRFHAKQGRSTGRLVLETPTAPITVYLKRHWRLPWRQRIAATLAADLGHTPAGREWDNLSWAQGKGIAVPTPLACGELIGPWFALRSFLIVRELTGMLPLHEAVPLAAASLPTPQFGRWKRLVLRQVAALAAKLHSQSIFHKDFYLCHFYVEPPAHADAGMVHLIDLHRLARHRWFARRWKVKDLAQLLFSTWGVAGIDDSDRRAFLHRYGQLTLERPARGGLLRRVLAKARRYARHQQRGTAGIGVMPGISRTRSAA